MPKRVSICRPAWNVMAEHTRAAYPREGCGGMWGMEIDDEVRILLAVALPNRIAESQTNRYEVDPEDLLRADQTARDRGYRLAGIFHSHPDARAYFSETDLRNSCPWYLYVVLAVSGGLVTEVRCWKPAAEGTSASEVAVSLLD